MHTLDKILLPVLWAVMRAFLVYEKLRALLQDNGHFGAKRAKIYTFWVLQPTVIWSANLKPSPNDWPGNLGQG